MKKRVIATCLLASSLLPAALVRSQAEYSDSSEYPPGIDWNSVSGVMWAQRNISTYVLTSQGMPLGLPNYNGSNSVQDTAMAIASGGYNLFTTSNSTQQTSTNANLGLGLGLLVDNGPSDSYGAPGRLLAEWNSVPIVSVVDRGIPALDDYRRDFNPGGLLVGFGDDFQFTPPNLLLAGGSQSAAPTLNPLGLALRGVNPEAFGGAPSSVASAPAAAAPVQTTQVASVSTSAPTVLSSPVPAVTSVSTPTATAAPKQPEPTAAATPQAQTPVVSPTAPQSIATVAEAFMTTTVTTTSLSPAARALLDSRPNLVAQSLNPTADTPEPGSFAIMGLGFGLVAWKLRRRKQK